MSRISCGLNHGLIMVLISDHVKSFGQSWQSCWSYRNFGRSKIFLRSRQLIFNHFHRSRSYCIVAKCHKAHLRMLPNRGDRDQSQTGQTTHSIWMCCDSPPSGTTCYTLSGPVAHDLPRMTHKQIREDVSKCEWLWVLDPSHGRTRSVMINAFWVQGCHPKEGSLGCTGCKDEYYCGSTLNGPRREKTCLRGFGNNTGADQPAHPRSLISAFVIRVL